MTTHFESEYYSVGANRRSGAADWSTTSGVLAFGADQNVGIWSPLSDLGPGISALLGGHTAKVTAVKFLSIPSEAPSELLVTGCASGEVAIWKQDDSTGRWTCLDKIKAHGGTVNTVACLSSSHIFATGGADATVTVWKIHERKIHGVTALPLKPKFIPLTLAIGPFTSESSHDTAFLMVGGTRNDIQVYSLQGILTSPEIKLRATLTGHEAWIRSLALTPNPEGGYLLASASQDKYVRIWRFRPADNQSSNKFTADINATSTTPSNTLTAKIQSVSTEHHNYAISFEALLLGHEDWIYSASWNAADPTTPRLLTASADGSLSVWESDPVSGIWISVSRLGEISGQKGATTATGSAGGFWTGLWSPDGKSVTCLGRTGSWRLWTYDKTSQFWTQKVGITGHIGSVTGISWSPDGHYLVSTSSDQTTRLHAQWKRSGQNKRSWHEFSRPQIHGYDLNCIASISERQFSSGADEKLLRVFNQPRDIAHVLERLCGIPLPERPQDVADMPDTAAIPVLGLSNKAMEDDNVEEIANGDASEITGEAGTSNGHGPSLLNIDAPPTEDLLSRHTLWPEHEKLYGHGSEITEAASSKDGGILATACKASSIEHAVIRLYDTKTWNEMKPSLSAHSLTVTRLSFSSVGNGGPEYLLSVGRDRQWAVFKQSTATDGGERKWTRVANNPKAHARMILDATWLNTSPRTSFITAGRDKSVKVWSRTPRATQEGEPEPEEFTLQASIARKSPVTAVSATSYGRYSILAVGEEDGTISLHVSTGEDEMRVLKSVEVSKYLCPSRTVNRLAWRPGLREDDGGTGEDRSGQLAVASADGSVRILRVRLKGLLEVGAAPEST